MATKPPEVETPHLTFLPPHKTLAEMNNEGSLQTFMEVWLDAGSTLVDAFTIAEDNRKTTVGTEQVKWLKQSNKLDMELQRHQRLMVELRATKVVIEPPSATTMSEVDAVTKAVGALQLAQVKGTAALSAVAAALNIAQQIQGATAPSGSAPAAAPAPAPAQAVAAAPATP